MRIIRQICLLVGVLLSISSFSQQGKVASFTDDPVKFIEELKDFFAANTNDPKDAKRFLEKFEEVWVSGKFNESQKQATYEICNLMLKKRLRPATGFQDYLSSMMSLVNNTNQSPANFIKWQESIHKILEGKAIRYFTQYMSMSATLFESNTFFSSPTATWSSSNSNYAFDYDSLPKVVFSTMDLKCHNVKGDSGVVYGTNGIYYPSGGDFLGNGGTVTWERTGLDKNSVFAEIRTYKIDLKKAGFEADSVTFYNKNFFTKPLKGILNEKIKSYTSEKDINYPQFDSYDKRIQIPNILESAADYDGGFSMKGASLVGSGSEEADAFLYFKRNNKRFLIVSSKTILIDQEKFSSDNASVKFLITAEDSVFHPGLIFKYKVKDKKISLIRKEEGITKTPFFNSYHDIDMYFEELTWNIEEPTILMGMLLGNSQGEADFESSDFYKEFRFEKLQMGGPVNPLVQIQDFVKHNKNAREFEGRELAKFMKLTFEQVQPMIVRLSAAGFLLYDIDDDWVIVKQKLFDYVMARAGKKDYDVLNFHSFLPGQSNASFNLLTYDLTINGVKSILLSDSQSVFIYPKEQTVVLKRNRNFEFDGLVNAGLFEYFGKEFYFQYDSFKVNLTNVDSMRIRVRSDEKDMAGNYPMVRVKTVIENIQGELLIDHPKNKSGVQNLPKYPVFSSLKDSYVFYSKRSIQSGVYNRDKFYFHLEPFTIDSLDNFEKNALSLAGEMISAGIFPTFKENLTIQKDYSLGFIRQAPPQGFDLYGGKANFKNTIKMSHEGLRGDGVINYVTSTTKSDNFLFFPDSMNAYAQNFDVKEQKADIEFPQFKGEDVYVHWRPYKDRMQINKREKLFECYNGQAKFDGDLTLTPKLLSGKGLAEFSEAELEAKHIRFKQNEFDSDTADFRLKALELSSLAFSTTNVNAHIDFNQRFGDFKSNGKGSVVNFPVNQYICYMERFKWYMDQNSIALVGDKKQMEDAVARDIDLSGPEFISVHPDQDSLRFFSPEAKYDLKKYIISAKGVQYINVADARIFPDSGNVVIEKKAVMRPLLNSKIIANSITKYHTITGANVNIFGRKKYQGSGNYDYVDELKNKQTIYFSSITVDTTFQTFAETEIKEENNFMLSPNFDYKGKVKLAATNQFLTFEGTAKIHHNCDALPKTWFAFKSEIDPDKIYIPITKDIRDASGKQLAASLMLTKDSTNRVYSAFLTEVYLKSDVFVLPAEGYLFFDKSSREYRISNKEKLVERALPGNYVSLNTNNCSFYGEGGLDLGAELGQVKYQTVGNASHFQVNDSLAMNIMMLLNFFFENSAIDKMADQVVTATNLKPVEFGRPLYEKGLIELLGKEKADKLIAQVNLYGSFKKFPDELEKTLFITDMKMKWDKDRKSYVSEGKIGIGNINKTQVNKYVDGRIEIGKRRTGDEINIYLEIDAANWYYFNYSRGFMQAISSNESFNTIIKELKSDKREMKTPKGEMAYKFNLSTERKKRDFLSKTERGGAED